MDLHPILKWIGGKTQLLDVLSGMVPQSFGCYYEPFIGGGALLFHLQPCKAIIGDTNPQLINLYCQLQRSPQAVLDSLALLNKAHIDKDFYLTVRDRYNEKISKCELDVECAALMVWVNKHCFNGLYRVNKKGMFNAAYNNKAVTMDIPGIRLVSEYFQSNTLDIRCADFESTVADVKAGDFVYFDSPYVPEGATAKFVEYTLDGFSLADHKRLADTFRRLDRLGAQLLLSNNDVELVHQLYSGYHIQSVPAKRSVNRDGNKRMGREVVISNY